MQTIKNAPDVVEIVEFDQNKWQTDAIPDTFVASQQPEFTIDKFQGFQRGDVVYKNRRNLFGNDLDHHFNGLKPLKVKHLTWVRCVGHRPLEISIPLSNPPNKIFYLETYDSTNRMIGDYALKKQVMLQYHIEYAHNTTENPMFICRFNLPQTNFPCHLSDCPGLFLELEAMAGDAEALHFFQQNPSLAVVKAEDVVRGDNRLMYAVRNSFASPRGRQSLPK